MTTLQLNIQQNYEQQEKQEEQPFFYFSSDSLLCFKFNNTIICGTFQIYDHQNLDDDISFEPFYGDTNIFG
jgi:hypothetical protein